MKMLYATCNMRCNNAGGVGGAGGRGRVSVWSGRGRPRAAGLLITNATATANAAVEKLLLSI